MRLSRGVLILTLALGLLAAPLPTVLIHDGRTIEEHLRRERISRDDLHGALRRAGLVEVSEARFAVLEANGGISVIPWRTEAKSVR